jgi:hypothetical protein|eukprot:COSAG01_NODE_441_length_17032_cov_27.546389_16_plen_102_part_00
MVRMSAHTLVKVFYVCMLYVCMAYIVREEAACLPASIARGTWYAWCMSRVQTPAPNPYSVSLAMAMASSAVLNVVADVTGPNISSWNTLISFVPPRIVGLM